MGDGNNNVKLTGIRQIVRLRSNLQKWHSITLGQKGSQGATSSSSSFGIPPSVSERLKNLSSNCDSDDDEGCISPMIPKDVPKGYVPVYVGSERQRFVIPTSYLGKPMFKLLLKKAEEEFGFDQEGALTIPCEIEMFKHILQFMDRHQKGLIDDEGNPTGLGE